MEDKPKHRGYLQHHGESLGLAWIVSCINTLAQPTLISCTSYICMLCACDCIYMYSIGLHTENGAGGAVNAHSKLGGQKLSWDRGAKGCPLASLNASLYNTFYIMNYICAYTCFNICVGSPNETVCVCEPQQGRSHVELRGAEVSYYYQ